MSIKDLKFDTADFSGKDISSLPDRPGDSGITGQQLKERFDLIPKMVIALGGFNGLIDELSGENGAANIGISPIDGVEGETVQGALGEMGALTRAAKAAADTAAEQGRAAEDAANNAAEAAENAANKAANAENATGAAIEAANQAAQAAAAATTAITEVKSYAEEKAQESKEYVDSVIIGAGAVTSVFGRAGDVMPLAGDYTAEMVGARPDTWMPTAKEVGARPDNWTPGAEDVGAIPDAAGTVTTEKLADGAVTAEKLADGAVTAESISAIPASEKGAANGVATLGSNGKVTATQASAAIGYCTANKTLTADDMGKLIVCYSSALTVTIPAGMPQGTEVEIVRWGNTAVTIAAASGTTLKSSATARTIKNQYGVVSLKRISSSTDDWLLVGDLG